MTSVNSRIPTASVWGKSHRGCTVLFGLHLVRCLRDEKLIASLG